MMSAFQKIGLKSFYAGVKDFHKTFWGTTKKCENKNLD